MSSSVFISAETTQFAEDREKIRQRLASILHPMSQEALVGDGNTIKKITTEIKTIDLVLCLIGNRTGALVREKDLKDKWISDACDDYLTWVRQQSWERSICPADREPVSYTQLEVLFALRSRIETAFVYVQFQQSEDPKDKLQRLFRDWLLKEGNYHGSEEKPESIARDDPAGTYGCKPGDIENRVLLIVAKWLARPKVDEDPFLSALLPNACRAVVVQPLDPHLTPRPELTRELLQECNGRRTILVAGNSFGKSSLLQLINRCHPMRVIASYCFDLDHEKERAPLDFVAKIAAQTSKWVRRRLAQDVAVEESNCHKEIRYKSADRAWRALWNDLQRVQPTDDIKTCYVLIDALDEEKADPSKSVLDILCRVPITVPPWLGLIATAQPVVFSGKYGDDLANWRVVDKRDLKTQANKQELDAAMRKTCEDRVGGLLDRKTQIIEALLNQVSNNFLYLDHLLRDIETVGGSGVDEGWVKKQPDRLEEYYLQRFEAWFPTKERILGILSVMLALRSPQSPAVLAVLCDIKIEDARDLLGRMSTFLEGMPSSIDSTTICEFRHSTIRKWLPSKDAGPFRVSKAEGHMIIGKESTGLADFLPGRRSDQMYGDDEKMHAFFLVEGVHHMLEAVRAERAPSTDQVELILAAVRILAAMHAQVESPDIGHYVSGALNDYNRKLFDLLGVMHRNNDPRLPAIEVSSLVEVIKSGCNEIPKLYSPLRILIDYHLNRLDEYAKAIIASDQLLSRYSLGRAIADSYHFAPQQNRDRHQQDLRDVVWGWYEDRSETETASDLREAGCYALKFLFAHKSQTDRKLEEYLPTFTKTCATNCNYNHRMAYCEMLIELAIAGRRLSGESVLYPFVPYPDFWRPYWPYHELDLFELIGTLRVTGEPAGMPHEGTPVDDFAARNSEPIEAVRARLEAIKDSLAVLYKKHSDSSASRLANCLKWENYRRPEQILRSLPRAADALRDEERIKRMEIGEFLEPFVLHPVWEVTEAAASVAAEIRSHRREDIDKLLNAWNEKEDPWQYRYAAVDAAYNSRHLDRKADDELFTNFVRKNYQLTHTDVARSDAKRHWSRVQYICAEDVFLAFSEAVDLFAKKAVEHAGEGADGQAVHFAVLEQPREIMVRFKTEIKWWFARVEDCAILEELFRFTKTIMENKENRDCLDPCKEEFERWFEEVQLSRYLTLDGQVANWWEMSRDDWLQKMDGLRKQEMTRHR